MSFAYTRAKRNIFKADIDFDVDTFKVALVMTNTTADTEEDTATISAFSVLDEMDGSGYVRKTVSTPTVSEDDPNNRAEFTFDAITWTALGDGTRQVAGFVLFKFVTNDSDSVPIAYINSGGFPVSPGGLNFTITPNAEGVLQLT